MTHSIYRPGTKPCLAVQRTFAKIAVAFRRRLAHVQLTYLPTEPFNRNFERKITPKDQTTCARSLSIHLGLSSRRKRLYMGV